MKEKRRRVVPLICALVACAAACSSEKEEPPVPDQVREVLRIGNRSGEVELVLTTRTLYMQLSEAALAEVDTELEEARESLQEESGLAQSFASFIIDSVGDLLDEAIVYPIDEVERIDWQAGELVVEVADPNLVSFDDVNVDGEPVLATFDEASARQLIAAFERLTSGR